MPDRTFRVVLTNSTKAFTLNQTFNHLCWGDYTPGGWCPPPSIPPNGGIGAWQGESGGPCSGTQAYVKYSVDAPDGSHGMIYVYWDNPFWGNTAFRFVGSKGEFPPDCDYDNPGGYNFQRDSAKLDFQVNFNLYAPGPDGGGDITSWDDLLIYAVGAIPGSNVLTSFGYMMAVAGIDKYPELYLEVVDRLPSVGDSFGQFKSGIDVFGSLGPATLQPLTQASRSEWVGRWANGDVSVDITLSSSGFVLTAAVYDGSTNPPLSFSQPIVPGPAALLTPAVPWLNSLVHSQALEPAQRAQFAVVARDLINQAASSPTRVVGVSGQFQSAVAIAQGGKTAPATSVAARQVGRAIANLLLDGGGVAYLRNHVVLKLYGVMQSGDRTGMRMLFQRLDEAGNQITGIMLDFVSHLT